MEEGAEIYKQMQKKDFIMNQEVLPLIKKYVSEFGGKPEVSFSQKTVQS